LSCYFPNFFNFSFTWSSQALLSWFLLSISTRLLLKMETMKEKKGDNNSQKEIKNKGDGGK
jgi:hypothetical protein